MKDENQNGFIARYKAFRQRNADAVERAGVSVYGQLGGEAGARDEKAAVDAARQGHWGKSIKSSLEVEADMGRHLLGYDRSGRDR